MELTNNILASKKATTEHAILDVLAVRYSPRAFKNHDVSDEVLGRIFEAMRWAPSSMNEQPWRIIFARKGEAAHDKIVQTLMSGNKSWAEKAPILMLTLVKKVFQNGSPNEWAKYDVGLAIGNLSTQATHEGVGLHQMGGFSPEKAVDLFDIPFEYEPVTAIALGYYGDPNELPDGLRERELATRKRKPLTELVFHEKLVTTGA